MNYKLYNNVDDIKTSIEVTEFYGDELIIIIIDENDDYNNIAVTLSKIQVKDLAKVLLNLLDNNE